MEGNSTLGGRNKARIDKIWVSFLQPAKGFSVLLPPPFMDGREIPQQATTVFKFPSQFPHWLSGKAGKKDCKLWALGTLVVSENRLSSTQVTIIWQGRATFYKGRHFWPIVTIGPLFDMGEGGKYDFISNINLLYCITQILDTFHLNTTTVIFFHSHLLIDSL